ncbi:hypothetical protein QQ056_11965 [Oscillatoria laete-virens NRMC-F 0139]|nr:hypothetical protein [Oscillatoria laete-virens NRMC-F 0139]
MPRLMKQPPHKSKANCPGPVTIFRQALLIVLMGVATLPLSAAAIGELPAINRWQSASRAQFAEQIARADAADWEGFVRQSGLWLRDNLAAGGVDRREWNEVRVLRQWTQLFLAAQRGGISLTADDRIALMQNADLGTHFLDEITPADDPARAVAILTQLRNSDPKAFGQYSALASALALVFDTPPAKTDSSSGRFGQNSRRRHGCVRAICFFCRCGPEEPPEKPAAQFAHG